MKFSKSFDRDYNFYLGNLKTFNFCGTLNPKYAAIPDDNGLSAKECFYLIESQGINKPCCQIELLNALLLTKASVNFQIKEWAQGRADGTLPLIELSKRQVAINYPELTVDSATYCLDYINGEPFHYQDIETQYNLPEWVINAVENQKIKHLKNKYYESNRFPTNK